VVERKEERDESEERGGVKRQWRGRSSTKSPTNEWSRAQGANRFGDRRRRYGRSGARGFNWTPAASASVCVCVCVCVCTQ
jgi:hypothetical protein